MFLKYTFTLLTIFLIFSNNLYALNESEISISKRTEEIDNVDLSRIASSLLDPINSEKVSLFKKLSGGTVFKIQKVIQRNQFPYPESVSEYVLIGLLNTEGFECTIKSELHITEAADPKCPGRMMCFKYISEKKPTFITSKDCNQSELNKFLSSINY